MGRDTYRSAGMETERGRVKTLRPRQNGCHFPDDIFTYFFLNENVCTSLTISLKFVPKVRINNIPALVQIMAWRRPGDKPLSEPMMVNSQTHICVTLPQWVKTQPGPSSFSQKTSHSSLGQIISWFSQFWLCDMFYFCCCIDICNIRLNVCILF